MHGISDDRYKNHIVLKILVGIVVDILVSPLTSPYLEVFYYLKKLRYKLLFFTFDLGCTR